MLTSGLRSGTVISHYRILSAVGSGGMGEVYLAHDERLGRKVALKILPSDFAGDRLRRERFEREARATSSLNHPNILTIYDFDEAGGHYFIATEFIDGETLRRRLSGGKLKLKEVMDISIQAAGALAAAHGEGVVHRDIKPENIMIRRDGYVKVLDFGLARVDPSLAPSEPTESATLRRFTDEGVVMGTVRYMSPEQAQGLPVDGRSDIFSLGVAMYEMITGRVPFEGATRSHVFVSLLEKQPAPLNRDAPDAPAELQRIIGKCLSKDPDERYQVAKDLVIDLKSLRRDLEASAVISEPSPVAAKTSSAEFLVGEIKRHKKSALIGMVVAALIAAAILILPTLTREAESGQRIPIAVADFTNETGQPELDGLSGMLITSLEQSRRLAVMTRSRMFDTLKRLGKDPVDRIDENTGREICRAENVNALVTASISRLGDLYILDLKVLDPEKNEYLFTAKEQTNGVESIPHLIDVLSDRTRLALREKSDEVKSSSAKIANVTTANMEAYQHYFQGQQLSAQIQFEKAEQEFRKATAIDPTFALAHYGRAYALSWTGLSAREPILQAVRYIEKAPEKERFLIRAEKAIAVDRDWGQAIVILRQLLARYPEEKSALFIAGDLSFHKEDFVSAEQYLRKVVEMDPTFEAARQHLVWTYRDSGQFSEAVDAAQRYVAAIPTEEAFVNLISSHAAAGDLDQALASSRRAVERFQSANMTTHLVMTRGFRGEYDAGAAEARKLLSRDRPAGDRQIGQRLLALLHSYRGEYRAALARFDDAIELAREANDPVAEARTVAEKAEAMAWSRFDDAKARRTAARVRELESSIDIHGQFALFKADALLGEFESARAIAREHFWGSRTPVNFIDGLEKLDRGDAAGAVRAFDKVVRAEAVLWNGSYFLALAQLEAGQYDQAIASAQRAQQVFLWITPPEHIYARTYYLLGKAYERKGDRKAAVANYRLLLDRWKTADKDLPDLIDARNRLAQLIR
jgi:serine/threonine protein kinase/tetratricopeptide (TPR) repeat protein